MIKHNELLLKDLWNMCLGHIPNIRASKNILIFLGIPILSLVTPLPSQTDQINLGNIISSFLIWYLPFLLLSLISYRKADKYQKEKAQKKQDQSVLLFWVTNLLTLTVLALLLQYNAFMDLQEGLLFDGFGNQQTVLLWFTLLDIILILASVISREKIFVLRISWTKKQDVNGGKSQTKIPLIFIITFISVIIITQIGFPNIKAIVMFGIALLVSALILMNNISGIYQLLLLYAWRKNHYWK